MILFIIVAHLNKDIVKNVNYHRYLSILGLTQILKKAILKRNDSQKELDLKKREFRDKLEVAQQRLDKEIIEGHLREIEKERMSSLCKKLRSSAMPSGQ